MISIIGAGPAGSYAAYLLAKAGKEVEVFEEHDEIGNPIQCSGVITPFIESLIPLKKEIIVNKIKKVRFHAPNGSFCDVPIKEDYVFDRCLLDRHLADLAQKEGVKFNLNKRFKGFEKKEKELHVKFEDKTIKSEVLVGADGPHSLVGKSAGLIKKRRFITGIQARAKADIVDKHLVEIFLGKGDFGWLIPENEETARIGVVAERNCKKEFDEIMRLRNGKFICYQSGLIPVFDPFLKTQKENVYLIGDAAGQVKKSTHGGILFSMLAGKELCTAITQNKNYDLLWKKELGFDLYLNKTISDMLSKFSDKELNSLVELFAQEKLKKILSSNVRDFPSKFLFQMLVKEPRLLKFSKKII
ncbi:MAG: NAD(P)/FAD-dependent oxidoreductase [Candidatus Nanoarchaeia archaeon]